MTASQLAFNYRLGLLVKEAYADTPPAGLPDGLVLVDSIMATDPDGSLRTFGLIAEDDEGAMYVGIRGTRTPAEWLADFAALVIACPLCPGAGVEAGFWSIYRTFVLATGRAVVPLLEGAQAVYVAGHSLGGPLATLLASQVKADRLVGFASPKPGDGEFAAWARFQVQDITLLANLPDVVPHVPLSLPRVPFLSGLPIPLEFDFEHIGPLTMLNSTGTIKPGLAAAHDLDTYLHLINPAHPVDAAYRFTP